MGQGERQPQRKKKDPTSTAALSRTNGTRPMEIAGKWSECSLSKEYIKMQKEAEKLDAEKQKPHP